VSFSTFRATTKPALKLELACWVVTGPWLVCEWGDDFTTLLLTLSDSSFSLILCGIFRKSSATFVFHCATSQHPGSFRLSFSKQRTWRKWMWEDCPTLTWRW